MGTGWRALHAQLLDTTLWHDHQRQFRALARGSRPLAAFADTTMLLAHLHAPGGDPAAKDGLLRALVAAAQAGGPTGEVAQVILLLALWPGLDAIYGRLWRPYSGRGDDLASDLSARLTLAIAHLDLSRVSRVGATLLMNLERDLKRDLRAAWQQASCTDTGASAEDVDPFVDPAWSEPVPDAETRLDRQRLPDRLRAEFGRDGALLAAMLEEDLSQEEAGLRLDLGSAAARKRVQRACARLLARATDILGTDARGAAPK